MGDHLGSESRTLNFLLSAIRAPCVLPKGPTRSSPADKLDQWSRTSVVFKRCPGRDGEVSSDYPGYQTLCQFKLVSGWILNQTVGVLKAYLRLSASAPTHPDGKTRTQAV